MLRDQVDVAGQRDLPVLWRNCGDEAPAWNGVIVVRADAQRVAEVAKCLERDAITRPAFEFVGAIGGQKMPALLVEISESGPAFAGFVHAEKRLQWLGAISVARKLRDERGEALIHPGGACEIEPFHAAALGLLVRKCGPVTPDRFLHQDNQVPG